MNNSFPVIQDQKIVQAVIWKDLWEKLGLNKISKGWIYVSEEVENTQNEWWKKVSTVLTNPREQAESTINWIGDYVYVDTTWWEKIVNFVDFSWKITDATEKSDWKITEITYPDNGNTIMHKLYQEDEVLSVKLSDPEEYLTKLFWLREDQFKRNWKLIMSERIKFDVEQRQKIQQLLHSKVLHLSGYRHPEGEFILVGEMGCLWTSIPGIHIDFNEFGFTIQSENNTKLSLSAFCLF